MAQRASFRVWPILRWILLGLGVVVLLALVIPMWNFVETRSPESREKLYLSVLDKLFLGGVIVFLGYLVQKQLEVFKRDQGLAAELAKARIAAYNRVFAAVGLFDAVGGTLLLGVHGPRSASSESIKQLAEEFDKADDALIELLKTDRYLLGDPFRGVLIAYIHRLREDVHQAMSGAQPSAEEQARRQDERLTLHRALTEKLPPFARIPEGDQSFESPDFSQASIDVLMEMDQAASKK